MTSKSFRFGIVAGFSPDLAAWTAQAKQVEQLGLDTMLATDPVAGSDPLTLVPAAAAVTSTLRVGTFVLADPFRDPRQLDWQVRTLHRQTGGRFELGLGAGRPGADDHARSLGRDYPGMAQRIERLEATIELIKSTPDRPKLLMAARGPKMLALAAREADIVTFSWLPRTTPDEALSIVDKFRELAGARLGEIELAVNLMAIGDEPAPHVARFAGVDVPELAASGAVTVLPADPGQATDTLLGWREKWGISYATVNSGYLQPFAAIARSLRALA
ncbi:LLM class flavin-dependent oxidoreductase [Amycolatopsis sp. NPDC059027]|uniref:LLM class flavin-dependent oxidoreductase n=1 Tax=Amycolatopsis sp. NPDC059027 TaxID=3346709 RepID=UPI00366F5E24